VAKSILLDCNIVINGVDLSDHVASVEISLKRKTVDSTNFSGGGAEAMLGLKSDSFIIELQQDFAASQVNSILLPLYENGTEFTVVVKPHNASVSATNPTFTGTCILPEYQALTGKVGDLSTSKITFPTQRTGITMATS
jgi:hypothetical protein